MDDFDLIWEAIQEEKKRNRKANRAKSKKKGKKKADAKHANSEIKRCTECGEMKPGKDFYYNDSHKDGLWSQCKSCVCAYQKAYHEKNCEKIHARKKAYHEENSEKICARGKAYRKRNPEKIRAYNKAYRKAHRNEHNTYTMAYLKNNIKARLSCRVSCAMWRSLKSGKQGAHWESLVPYTLSDLIAWLEFQWEDGMDWTNYGKGEKGNERNPSEYWVIDHVRPVSSYTFSSPDDPEFQECWALSNLRPCWAKENMEKGAKYPYNPPARNKDDEDAKEAS